jgi:hypothetical protein
MPHKKIFPRGELFPRAQVPQGPGYFTPTKVAPTVDTRGKESNHDMKSKTFILDLKFYLNLIRILRTVQSRFQPHRRWRGGHSP